MALDKRVKKVSFSSLGGNASQLPDGINYNAAHHAGTAHGKSADSDALERSNFGKQAMDDPQTPLPHEAHLRPQPPSANSELAGLAQKSLGKSPFAGHHGWFHEADDGQYAFSAARGLTGIWQLHFRIHA